MNKRDLVMRILDANQPHEIIPAAFFLHFDPQFHRGQAAVDKHMEFFRYTGMDFVKIQYENAYPTLDSIRQPQDWAKMPFLGADFYEGMLNVVKGLVAAAKSEALVVLTLYSPFMNANHAIGEERVVDHIRKDPQAVAKGMQVITDSLLAFVKDCIAAGLDGFYMSTQGGEAGRLGMGELFETCVRPFDLQVMETIQSKCAFNILHVCDYRLPYAELSPFVKYPGQVVNSSLELADGTHTTPAAVAELFGRPFMGGMERLGILAQGDEEAVRAEARRVCATLPDRAILAADCTVPATTPWSNLKAAIDVAHQFRAG